MSWSVDIRLAWLKNWKPSTSETATCVSVLDADGVTHTKLYPAGTTSHIFHISPGSPIYITIIKPGWGWCSGRNPKELPISDGGYMVCNLCGADAGDPEVCDETPTERIDFTSNPVGATIYLDDVDIGLTPVTLFYTDIYIGAYSYKLTLHEYEDCTGEVTVLADQISTVHCDMVPIGETGSISFTSDPSYASIYLDGSNTEQQTPSTIPNIPAGLHTYTLKKIGYKPSYGTVNVIANETSNIHEDLEPEEPNDNLKYIIFIIAIAILAIMYMMRK